MHYSSLTKSYKDDIFENFRGGHGGGGGHGSMGHGNIGGRGIGGWGRYGGRYGPRWRYSPGYGSGYGYGPGWGYTTPIIYYTENRENCFCLDPEKLSDFYKICPTENTCGVCIPCNECLKSDVRYNGYCN